VLTALLDGPQLSSRWSARYASVLADDPGSAVLTITALGMVERSRPYGLDALRVIALWKDAPGGAQEIALEPGAQAVLLTIALDRATRYTATGAGQSTTARPVTAWPSTRSEPQIQARVRLLHPPPRGQSQRWILMSSASSRAGQRACQKLRHSHPNASIICWQRRGRARHGARSSASLGYPPGSLMRWNRSADWLERARHHPARRSSKRCLAQAARISPAKKS
jgi:hypothetical protein